MISAGVPQRYTHARLAEFPKQVATGIQTWMTQAKDGLLLTGPTGTGKTYLAAAIARTALETGRPVVFRRASDLYSEIRNTFNTDCSERDILGRYFHARLLILDDVGAGALTDFERRIALDVLDTRWGELRPTIITTNLSLDQIAERIDERVASRLRSFTAISLTGRDRRSRS